MSQHSSLLVEKLWRLKRLIDKGSCPNLKFVHLNNLLRDPVYRKDVLNKADTSGSEPLKQLVAEIRATDDGHPLLATSGTTTVGGKDNVEGKRGWLRRNLIWLTPSGVMAIAFTLGFTALEPQTIRVTDDITADTTWKSGKTYVLENVIFVDDAILTIESGVQVRGANGSALIVTKDSQLFARGRADTPVVFTSDKPLGQRARGDWGGVVLLGRAPVNQPQAVIEGIGQNDVRAEFGGQDASHSCGVIEFTRIEFAGYEVSSNNELNGLTLGACGSNTIIRNVQVHRALDDGIEMFGGTVDLKNIVVSGAGDDGIDWDWGWTGRVQFAIIQQHSDVGDNGIEGDNNGNNHDAQPRSEPTFYNVTMVGTGNGVKTQRGIILREGSGGHFHNMVIDSYSIEALDLRDDASKLINRGDLTFTHNLLANIGVLGRGIDESGENDDDFGFIEGDWLTSTQNQNQQSLASALNFSARDRTAPGFQSGVKMSQMSATAPPESEFFDESATYVGALSPRAQTPWLAGWTAFPEH